MIFKQSAIAEASLSEHDGRQTVQSRSGSEAFQPSRYSAATARPTGGKTGQHVTQPVRHRGRAGQHHRTRSAAPMRPFSKCSNRWRAAASPFQRVTSPQWKQPRKPAAWGVSQVAPRRFNNQRHPPDWPLDR